MSHRDRIFFWAVCISAALLFVWVFNQVRLPFVTGMVIAYLLNPLVVKLENLKIGRRLAAAFMLAMFIVLVSLLVVFLVPRVYRELLQLAQASPEYVDALWEKIRPMLEAMPIALSGDTIDQSLREILKNNISSALSLGGNLVEEILSSGRAFLDLFIFMLLTPLVSYMMLTEWPRIAGWIEDMLPRQQKSTILDLLKKIDTKVAGFIRGQFMVALVLGVIYAITLAAVGLDYGFLIGLVSGLLSIIPLFGSVVGLLMGVLAALLQGGSLLFTAGIAAVFLAGQFLEGNFITPRVMSGSVGLHPLWILFALMAGGALLGVLGMLLAIPVAASMGVLLQHFIGEYKSSKYYDTQT